MSRIDELQRLHEEHQSGTPGSAKTSALGHELFVRLYGEWPAIHRALVAARNVDKAPTWTALEEELRNLGHELRALDGGA